MDLWRISSFSDLSGRGGLLADGRWHRRGQPVIYCADHPSTAMLEVLVHVDPEDIPDSYQLLRIACPADIDTVRIDDVDPADIILTRDRGSRWLEEGKTVLAEVPSVVMPAARNILLNPRHPAMAAIAVAEVFHYPFDRRLKR